MKGSILYWTVGLTIPTISKFLQMANLSLLICKLTGSVFQSKREQVQFLLYTWKPLTHLFPSWLNLLNARPLLSLVFSLTSQACPWDTGISEQNTKAKICWKQQWCLLLIQWPSIDPSILFESQNSRRNFFHFVYINFLHICII